MLTINLRHLYFFMEVARLRSVTAAANNIHLSQPAITQAVGNVERFFDTALLVRNSTGVTLTAAGELCQSRIERAFMQLQEGIGDLTRTFTNVKRARLLRSLSTSQVDALLAVVDHRSFSAAARARRVSQPTIHRAAHELERLIGVSLFEKTSYGVVPTRDAERFAIKARLAFAEISQAHAEVRTLTIGKSGRTVIGALPLARTFLLPTAIMQFSNEHPHHQIEIVEGTYEHLLDGLRKGEIDLFIGAMRDKKTALDVVEEHLFDDPLSLIMRAGHPLLRKKRITMPMLVNAQWVSPRPGSPLREVYNNMFITHGMNPPFASIECNSISAARSFLLESDMIMLLSAHQVHVDLRLGILKSIAPRTGRINRSIGITWRRDWRPTNTQEKLIATLRAGTPDNLPGPTIVRGRGKK